MRNLGSGRGRRQSLGEEGNLLCAYGQKQEVRGRSLRMACISSDQGLTKSPG
jgi:hypothetical protein